MTTQTKTASLCEQCERECEDVIDGWCEECEEGSVYCNVCRERFSRESDWCRHVFWTSANDGGSGSYEGDWDDCQESFFHLLDLIEGVSHTFWDLSGNLGSSLVKAIETRITADDFWTFTSGPCIGAYPDSISFRCNYTPENPNYREYRYTFADLRGDAIRIWEEWPDISEDATKVEAATLGWQWLESLDGEETKKANARTVAWILAWRLSKRSAA
jgi:hypothetical protein